MISAVIRFLLRKVTRSMMEKLSGDISLIGILSRLLILKDKRISIIFKRK